VCSRTACRTQKRIGVALVHVDRVTDAQVWHGLVLYNIVSLRVRGFLCFCLTLYHSTYWNLRP
jgi:hypothetical protein